MPKTKLTNDYEAYNLALRLAITAPTEKLSGECIQIAETIGHRLPESFKTNAAKTLNNHYRS